MNETPDAPDRPQTVQHLERLSEEWPAAPNVLDLDDCTITFRGQSVSGERLAELLGMSQAEQKSER